MSIVPDSLQHIIAVASGKGGVGKSTTAVNLALALQQAKQRVGILDADIYGPNLPQLLGVQLQETLKPNANQQITPVMAYGIASMSIGYLVGERVPAVWRGPMASAAVQQLLRETQWGPLDYLIIDLPPGTGDIHLTLAQKLSLQGAIMVTTPQSVALSDVRKSIEMFQKVRVPLLGVIENMGAHQCLQCGHVSPIFGEGGGVHLSQEYELPLLGSIPLDSDIRQYADQGKPITIASPDSNISQAYQKIANILIETLKKRPSKRFPSIVIE